MWPELAGPRWEWHLLTALGLLAGLTAVVALMVRGALREQPASPDPMLTLWHRYEVGDLTRREFERQRAVLVHPRPAPVTLWTRPPAMDPAVRRALNDNARRANGAAAARAKAAGA